MKFKYEIELEITDGLYETGKVDEITNYKEVFYKGRKMWEDELEENIADILEDELHIVLGEIGIVVNVEIIEWNW